MDNTLIFITCAIEGVAAVIAVVTAKIFRNPQGVRQNIVSAQKTTSATRRQWGAILTGILGANAGYLLLVSSFLLMTKFQSPEKIMDAWLVDVAWVSYLCLALPTYLGIGAVTGLMVDRYATKKSLVERAGTVLNLAISTGVGALTAIPIYFLGMMGAAL